MIDNLLILLNDTTALCEDGSVWRYANEKWVCILEAPSKENK